MPYSTQELIQILDQELHAHWRGERLLLSSLERMNNTVIAQALGPKKLSRVFAYQDFRAQIHEYQRQHQVSGLVQRQCQINGTAVQFPELHNQLIAIPGDKEKLIQAKKQVISTWRQTIQQTRLWLVEPQLQEISASQADELIQNAEWAELEITQKELFLVLCWGNPQECHYHWSRPSSGCERIMATLEPRS